VELHEFYAVPSVINALGSKDKKLPIALNNEDLEAFCIDFGKHSHINITGDRNCGKTNLIKVILESLSRKKIDSFIYIVDDTMLKLRSYEHRFPDNSQYLTTDSEIAGLLSHLTKELTIRQGEYVQRVQTKEITLPAAEYYATLPPHFVIVNNIANFLSKLSTAQHNELATLLDETRFTGIHFCFVSNLQDYPKNFDKLPTAIKNIPIGITLLPLTTQNTIQPVPTRFPVAPLPLNPGEANYIHSGSATLIKIPLVPTGGEQEK
jgi:hypothetical protein